MWDFASTIHGRARGASNLDLIVIGGKKCQDPLCIEFTALVHADVAGFNIRIRFWGMGGEPSTDEVNRRALRTERLAV
jgi:hypothetical protein